MAHCSAFFYEILLGTQSADYMPGQNFCGGGAIFLFRQSGYLFNRKTRGWLP